MLFEYDATTTRIFEIPPYTFFAVVGLVFAISLFVLLLLKYDYNIPRYTKIFLLSGVGLFAGANIFGWLTGLYRALANGNPINLDTFFNTGIVFYGGMLGFLSSFLLIYKIWEKRINYEIVDLAVVSIPLFHFWGRLGCFFAGCCYGIATDSPLSVLYTNYVRGEVITAARFPVQLAEAAINIAIFVFLFSLLSKKKLKGWLVYVYLIIYSVLCIILEFYRGDMARGVWNGVSFSQVVSILIILGNIIFFVRRRVKERKYEVL